MNTVYERMFSSFFPPHEHTGYFLVVPIGPKDKRQRGRFEAQVMSDSGPPALLHVLLAATFLLVIVHPVVLAEAAWEEDGWLRTSYGQDRLDAGDEFGCYGIPGLSWSNDPGAVAQACQDYITQRINASQWAANPLSIYTPSTLTMADHQKISTQGFVVHGDETGLMDTAWHHENDEPVDLWEWYNLGRRGGSLEKGIASLEHLSEVVEEGGLVNMYWIGRVNDATVRHDAEVLAYLDEHPGIWLTTWGEAWSLWSAKRCYEHAHSLESSQSNSTLLFESLITEACLGVSEGLPWNVPLTWRIETGGATVVGVESSRGVLPSIEGEKTSQEGWWQQDDGVLLLSVVNGHGVSIHFDQPDVDYDILGQTQFFNNHSTAVTVAGHETTDLFKWSKRFLEDTDVRFTWLVQPRPAEGMHAWIPYAVLGVGFCTVVLMLGVLGREGIGPLAGVTPQEPDTKHDPLTGIERSLDAEEAE